MPPVARRGALEYGVLRPIIYHAALGAELDIKTTGAAHVERDHVIVYVTPKRARELDASCDPSVVAATYLVDIIRFKHQVYTLSGHRHFKQPKAVMSSIAMHEPESLHGFGGVRRESDFHQVRQSEPEYIRVEVRHLVKVGGRDNDMAHALIARYESRHAYRRVKNREIGNASPVRLVL